MMPPKPRKPPRYRPARLPWRQQVTLCVAVDCSWDYAPTMVLACDFNTETDISSAEIQMKMTYITSTSGEHLFPCLLAGSLSCATRLLTQIQSVVRLNTGRWILDSIRDGVRQYKNDLADDIVATRFGMSYESFLKNSSQFPDELYRNTLNDIATTPLGASLILAYPGKEKCDLYRITDNGSIEYCHHFCAIGSGLFVAEAALFHRSHHSNVELGNAIYNVYEAMRLGSKAPGVGDRFGIVVVREIADKLVGFALKPSAYKALEKQYARYAPRCTPDLKVSASHLERGKWWPKK